MAVAEKGLKAGRGGDDQLHPHLLHYMVLCQLSLQLLTGRHAFAHICEGGREETPPLWLGSF